MTDNFRYFLFYFELFSSQSIYSWSTDYVTNSWQDYLVSLGSLGIRISIGPIRVDFGKKDDTIIRNTIMEESTKTNLKDFSFL